jgi:peptidoglycan biosynthesis protein MviN/MurJ (putative lipid II flippase)
MKRGFTKVTFVSAAAVFVLAGMFTPPYMHDVGRLGASTIIDAYSGFGFPLLIWRTGGFEHAGLWDYFRLFGLLLDLAVALAVGLAINFLCDRLLRARQRIVA